MNGLIWDQKQSDWEHTSHKRRKNNQITPLELKLLEFNLGKRVCSNSTFDRTVDLYLIAVVGVILFIILSLDSVDRCLSELVHQYWARLIVKAIIFFIVLYLVDRWLVCWRKRTVICTIDD